jgi:hypothetical protein
MKRVAIFVIALGYFGVANATILVAPSIHEAFSRSSIVAHVFIERAKPEIVQGEECGTRYSARILRTFKGKVAGGEKIVFGRLRQLIPFQSYLLFLGEGPTVENLLNRVPQSLIEIESLEKIKAFARCNGLVPGLEPISPLIWRSQGEDFKLIGLLPRSWPQSLPFRKRSSGDGIWIISETVFFSYLEKLARKWREKQKEK